MSHDNVVPFGQRAPDCDKGGAYEVVHYEPAAIHESVGIRRLLEALTRAGLTVSNVRDRGLVIHAIGHDPERPSPFHGATDR